MTARRDLAILANEGRLRRTHGGAVLPELAGHEDSFRSRLEQEAEQKLRARTRDRSQHGGQRDDVRRLLDDELLRGRAHARARRARDILNAVNDALALFGGSIDDLPISPVAVLRALGARPAGGMQ